MSSTRYAALVSILILGFLAAILVVLTTEPIAGKIVWLVFAASSGVTIVAAIRARSS